MGTTGRLLILVVAYNAEDHLKETLDRIPRGWLSNLDYHILILDDASEDETSSIADNYVESHQDLYITVSSHKENQGYGGNQKFGYRYAIDSDFDIVVLLHGDGQYAPEYLPKMVAPIHSKIADVVLGSRMIVRSEALKGGMPMYKWIGNQALTTLQNILLGSNLAEFHTGYRAYSVPVLSSLPIDANSDYFDFDT
ncbi:MAG: glycosyltransferase family 2 protein, partial [Bacteroidota bacterium]